MRFLSRIFLLCLFSLTVLQADVLTDLEHYIRSRVEGQSVAISNKCAFRQQLLLHSHFNELPADLKAMAQTFMPMPERQYQMVSPSGHFTLHYDLTGLHAVPAKDSLGNGIPDYIDSAAVILDHVWQIEIDQLGFNPPPDFDGNPVQSYPVFFSNMPYYGLTSFNYNEDIPSLPGYNYVSYLELHNNYQSASFASNGLEGLKVTAAHEFHHAIQLGYQLRWKIESGILDYPDLFFLEMSSTFMEDYVYDEINDYVQYVNRLIPNLEAKAFDQADGNTEYANALFLQLITQKFGVNILRQIWQNMIPYPALQAIDYTLEEYQSSFADCFAEYAGYFYFTGSKGQQGQFFKDAALFNQFRIKYSPNWLDNPLLPLHMRFNMLYVENSGVYQAVMTCNERGGRLTHIADGQQLLKPTSFGRGQIFSQNSSQPLIAVVTNATDQELTQLNYRLTRAPISVKNNPVKVQNSTQGVTFLYLPAASQVTIFNILGQKIKTLHGDSGNAIDWDLKDRHGRRVTSGIYFFKVKAQGFNYTGKITVLR